MDMCSLMDTAARGHDNLSPCVYVCPPGQADLTMIRWLGHILANICILLTTKFCLPFIAEASNSWLHKIVDDPTGERACLLKAMTHYFVDAMELLTS